MTLSGLFRARVPTRSTAMTVLDLLVIGNLFALIVIGLTGGIDGTVFRMTRAERPILFLIILIPLRITLGGPSRVLWMTAETRRQWILAFRQSVLDRLPASGVDVAFALIVTRPISVALGFIANVLFTPHSSRPFPLPFDREKIAEVFAAWDSGWYFDIASRGYYFRPEGQSSIAFFPLYPMLMRAAAWPFGGTDRAIWLAGIGISWLAFVLALLALHRLTERLCGDRQVARRAVLYLALFPFSIFFTRVYAESTFLLTSVLAVSRAHEGRWWRAGVWGALATLTRPNGILIGLPIGLMACRGCSSREVWRRLMALGLMPLALAGYCGYAFWLSGDPLAWMKAESQWGYSIGHPPWQLLVDLIGRLLKYGPYDYFFVSNRAVFHLFHGLAAILFLMLMPAIFKRLGPAMGAYVLVSLLVPLSGNALEGIGRYASVLFPAFIVIGTLKSPRLHEAILIGGSMFRVFLASLFATGQPIY